MVRQAGFAARLPGVQILALTVEIWDLEANSYASISSSVEWESNGSFGVDGVGW